MSDENLHILLGKLSTYYPALTFSEAEDIINEDVSTGESPKIYEFLKSALEDAKSGEASDLLQEIYNNASSARKEAGKESSSCYF